MVNCHACFAIVSKFPNTNADVPVCGPWIPEG